MLQKLKWSSLQFQFRSGFESKGYLLVSNFTFEKHSSMGRGVWWEKHHYCSSWFYQINHAFYGSIIQDNRTVGVEIHKTLHKHFELLRTHLACHSYVVLLLPSIAFRVAFQTQLVFLAMHTRTYEEHSVYLTLFHQQILTFEAQRLTCPQNISL